MSNSVSDNPLTHSDVCNPSYFSSLSSKYALSTGNSTTALFKSILPHIQSLHPINAASIVHDNAAGPGSALAAILGFLPKEDWPRESLITDINEDMINNAKSIFKDVHGVDFQVLDSQHLPGLQEAHFTHSIMNISLFILSDPVEAISRVRATLAPSGIAVFTNWSRFGASHVMHAAQRAIRPDLPLIPVPSPESSDLEYLAGCAEKAGFAKGQIETFNKDVVVEEGKWLDGLRGLFGHSPLVAQAQIEWTDEEKSRWMGEIEKAIQQEIQEHGGVYFEGAVLIVRK
ncbi:hypothetical protein NM208_g2488 [Fusarium decemcellulare]|uniref:Uncharacterized protein n=1 Tax=Fusarium decemcellulare TaxID=57161 RepID=A0ACC1SS98_9HYPO|nr:hypothetical protein NM208_g2488 [Fusarium decemcellulare]